MRYPATLLLSFETSLDPSIENTMNPVRIMSKATEVRIKQQKSVRRLCNQECNNNNNQDNSSSVNPKDDKLVGRMITTVYKLWVSVMLEALELVKGVAAASRPEVTDESSERNATSAAAPTERRKKVQLIRRGRHNSTSVRIDPRILVSRSKQQQQLRNVNNNLIVPPAPASAAGSSGSKDKKVRQLMDRVAWLRKKQMMRSPRGASRRCSSETTLESVEEETGEQLRGLEMLS